MNEFKFKVKEYFILSGGQIGIAGDMTPDNFHDVSNKITILMLSQ